MINVSLGYVKKTKFGKCHIIRHTRLLGFHLICRTLCGIDAKYYYTNDHMPTISQLCKTCSKISCNQELEGKR